MGLDYAGYIEGFGLVLPDWAVCPMPGTCDWLVQSWVTFRRKKALVADASG
jgi:hypothetical protein